MDEILGQFRHSQCAAPARRSYEGKAGISPFHKISNIVSGLRNV